MPASAGKDEGKKRVAVVVSLTGRVSIQANGTVVQDERFAGQLMATNGFDPTETSTAVGKAAEGMTFSRAGVPNERLGAEGKKFVSAFSAKIGGPPTGFAVHAAQAMDVLLDAIARSDGTRESVTRKLFSTRISNGLLGSFWITSTGDTTLNAVTIFRIAHHRVTTFHLVTVPEDLLDAAR
jgi:ABC-type branched-subunit amino acid transport system substrate-binding protein